MKVAVVFGGPSSEAEVSRASAAAVRAALENAGHLVSVHELTPALAESLRASQPDVVFPVAHGRQGEDGCLQGMLEILSFPYVGSDVRASASAADKSVAKLFFARAGLELARDRVLSKDEISQPPKELLLELREELGDAFLIKPVHGGSTLGMARVLRDTGANEFESSLQEASAYDDRVLIEELIEGIELTCGVLDVGEGARALPPTLIIAEATDWYDFESKYAPGGSTHQCPAPLAEDMLERVRQAALSAHLAVGARDLSRADFILTKSGRLVILEVNTLPGMTNVSLFPEAAQAAGISFENLVDQLVRQAQQRGVRVALEASTLPGL